VSSSLAELHLYIDRWTNIGARDIARLVRRKEALDLKYLKVVKIRLGVSLYKNDVDMWEEVKKSAEDMGVAFSIVVVD
jgi:hypothetical protein